MSADVVRKKNKGNYSYVIVIVGNEPEYSFKVIKYVKTRGKENKGKTKREIIFDEVLNLEQVLLLDDGVLKECIQEITNGGLNEK
ncbi:hypothetical protein [Xenorhabdus sp. KK7.4]|uniref:hypothetical protein n=1 Tax=Xenorhabdus sp. KK7.4 TaxID=1851572 RepID=UPI000C050E00|nr:hypothetical protein [Xenorhabdus sp. KK7.4]PHM51259.1 hypothetical protein Xekk_03832 [Xenorhabdus sp. KK7.4]